MTDPLASEWPLLAKDVIGQALVAQVATVTRDGRPVTWPMNPYLAPAGSTIDVSTGVTYPAKAERAKHNPKVGLLAGGGATPLVLIKALATVREEDLQANTDRYVRESPTKTAQAWRGQPKWLIRAQAWYWVRVFIELSPLEVRWWESGALDGAGELWRARVSAEETGETSAGEPTGTRVEARAPVPSAPWQRDPGAWRSRASYLFEQGFGPPTLTVMSPEGFPVPLPCRSAVLAREGFLLDLPESSPVAAEGSACLGFDRVYGGSSFAGQENAVFLGSIEGANGNFTVERLLPDFSLPDHGWAKYRNFLNARHRLSRRLDSECRRRGQPVPTIRLP
jgi:Pyridoxamine 5'-phosphate oxidase